MNSEGSSRASLLGRERKQGVREAELLPGKRAWERRRPCLLQWTWASMWGWGWGRTSEKECKKAQGAGERSLGL